MITNDKIYEQSLSWLMKQNEGLSKEEEQEFFMWLKDEENKKVYEQNKETFFTYAILGDFEKSEIKNDIKKDKQIEKFKKILPSLAASVLFIFISFAVFNYYESSKSLYKQDFYTKNEIKTNIKLPDDSIIDLDVKTKLHVDFYKDKRFVNLKEGKAIFSVKKDKNRVFQIINGKNQIEVLGTKFEVVSLNNTTKVNVIEGKVRVSHIYNENKKAKNLIILTKEQSLLLNQNGKILKQAKKEIRNIGNWKKGILKFQKATLQEVLKEFSRYHDFEIEFQNYELTQLNISGVFTINKIEDFLDSLAEIYPIKIKKENEKIYILEKS